MPAVATVTDFLDNARKSNQIDNERPEAFLAGRDDLPSEPRKLAKVLLREGVITTYQAEPILLGEYKGFYLGGYRVVEPANFLTDSSGTIKVLDLGLARVERPDDQSVTCKFNSSAVLGTADFLAPEQALNLHDVDSRADIYGLGATFYSVLTGHPP